MGARAFGKVEAIERRIVGIIWWQKGNKMKFKIRSLLGIGVVISTIFFLVGFKPVEKIKIVL